MKNLFKKTVNVMNNIVSQDNKDIIEEIHNSFDNAADDALAEALAILNSQEKVDYEKADTLVKLGFGNAKTAVKAREVRGTIHMSSSRAKTVEFYKHKYPNYKFIFKDQVTAICKKYGLICGASHRYVGDIPTKNLEEIRKFNVGNEDRYYLRRHTSIMYYTSLEEEVWRDSSVLNKNDYLSMVERSNKVMAENFDYNHFRSDFDFTLIPFFICAPATDMKISETEEAKGGIITGKIIPDPIVLHYVKDGFLIVSKWGLESSDESLND